MTAEMDVEHFTSKNRNFPKRKCGKSDQLLWSQDIKAQATDVPTLQEFSVQLAQLASASSYSLRYTHTSPSTLLARASGRRARNTKMR
jgi:hypothetical protein